MRNPIFLALDVSTKEEALALTRELAPVVGGFKVGSELFTNAGPEIVQPFAQQVPRFFSI
jgi:orotidine-5'-phosphate decarboxylase